MHGNKIHMGIMIIIKRFEGMGLEWFGILEELK
jgi:hypothetical protein